MGVRGVWALAAFEVALLRLCCQTLVPFLVGLEFLAVRDGLLSGPLFCRRRSAWSLSPPALPKDAPRSPRRLDPLPES